jgi:hypothetical protein
MTISPATSIHEAAHAVIAKLHVNCSVYKLEPAETFFRASIFDNAIISAAGWVAEQIKYKKSLNPEFFLLFQPSDANEIEAVYKQLGYGLGRKEWVRLINNTAFLVRKKMHIIEALAELHQRQNGYVSEEELNKFFDQQRL